MTVDASQIGNGATAIWSGYNHQGKVGLLVSLCEIGRVFTENSGVGDEDMRTVMSNWKIRFESGREDFDIISIDQGVESVYSRHQVKAKLSSTTESAYKDVFKPRVKKDKQGESVLDDDGNEITTSGFDCSGVDENSRYLHVIDEIDISGWSNDYSIRLYQYPALDGQQTKLYCSFSEIDASTDEMTGLAIAELKKLAPEKCDPELLVIWKDLQYRLACKISLGHRDKVSAEFSFQEICETLTSTDVTAYDNDRLRRSLLAYWDEYTDAKSGDDTFSYAMYYRAKNFITDLSSLSEGDFLRVVRLMHPDEEATLLNLQKNGLKEVILKVISEIVSTPYDTDCIKFEKLDASLILTTISNLTSEDTGSSRVAANRIIKTISEEDTAALFMKSKIVNKSLDSSFVSLIDLDKDTGRIAGRDYGDISSYAPIEFISADKAILELNAEQT